MNDVDPKMIQEVNPSQEISPNDAMFVLGKEHYFSAGYSALHFIQAAMFISCKDSFARILDFPCGHGRVLRFLKAKFPDAYFVAGDLDRDGVDFCARTFGAEPVYSNQDPQKISIEGSFDLIWCGSLLTHLNEQMCTQFVEFFKGLLAPNGILVFTMHGRLSVHWLTSRVYTYGLDKDKIPHLLDSYRTDGFGYLDYPDMQGYGISITSCAKTTSILEEIGSMRLLLYTESGWDEHQDVIACMHLPEKDEFKV